jgi:hypothetical protein
MASPITEGLFLSLLPIAVYSICVFLLLLNKPNLKPHERIPQIKH